MGVTRNEGLLPPRRFITRHDIEDAAARGGSLSLAERDTLTDEAAQRAAELGITIERNRADSPSQPALQAGPPTPRADPLRAAVRSAVVAELGAVPAGLDEAIDRVMERRRQATSG